MWELLSSCCWVSQTVPYQKCTDAGECSLNPARIMTAIMSTARITPLLLCPLACIAQQSANVTWHYIICCFSLYDKGLFITMETWWRDNIIINDVFQNTRQQNHKSEFHGAYLPAPPTLSTQRSTTFSVQMEVAAPLGLYRRVWEKAKHRQCWVYLRTLHSPGAGLQPAACWCPSAQNLRTWGSS